MKKKRVDLDLDLSIMWLQLLSKIHVVSTGLRPCEMQSKRYIAHNLLLRLQYTGFDDTYYVFFFSEEFS